MPSHAERRAPLVDLFESLALFAVPTAVLGVAALLGTGDALAGAVGGALFGAVLASFRLGFVAVRTENGLRRRLRVRPDDAEDGWLARLARREYDPRVEWSVVALVGAVGVASLAALVLVDSGFPPFLLVVGALGLPAALFAVVVTAVGDRSSAS